MRTAASPESNSNSNSWFDRYRMFVWNFGGWGLIVKMFGQSPSREFKIAFITGCMATGALQVVQRLATVVITEQIAKSYIYKIEQDMLKGFNLNKV